MNPCPRVWLQQLPTLGQSCHTTIPIRYPLSQPLSCLEANLASCQFIGNYLHRYLLKKSGILKKINKYKCDTILRPKK